jgi:methyl-accepting chemotaxis protein
MIAIDTSSLIASSVHELPGPVKQEFTPDTVIDAGPENSSFQSTTAVVVFPVIVPAAVTAYGVRYITDPIEKLIQAAKRVTAGEFTHRIDVRATPKQVLTPG